VSWAEPVGGPSLGLARIHRSRGEGQRARSGYATGATTHAGFVHSPGTVTKARVSKGLRLLQVGCALVGNRPEQQALILRVSEISQSFE